MLLLKADTKHSKRIQTAIGKLKGQEKKSFNDEVKRRMDEWTTDFISGKSAPFMNEILSGRARVPSEFKASYNRIVASIKEEIKFPGISGLAEEDPDFSMFDFDDTDESGEPKILNKTKLIELWKKETASADKKFPTIPTEKKVSESMIGRRKAITLSNVLAPYTKEKLANPEKPDKKKYPNPGVEPKEPKKPGKRAKESKVEEYQKAMKEYQIELNAYNKAKGLFDSAWNSYDNRVETRKIKLEQFNEEKANWNKYVGDFGKKFPQYLATDIEDGIEENQNNLVTIEDFQNKIEQLLKNPEVYNEDEIQTQYESTKLAEMMASDDKIKQLFERIAKKQLSPTKEETDKRRERVEKDVFMGLGEATTLYSSGTNYPELEADKQSYAESLKDFQSGDFTGTSPILGRWINESGLRDGFIESRKNNETKVVLENELRDYNELLGKLFDRKRVKYLKRKKIGVAIGSEDAAITLLKKTIAKEFGVTGITISRDNKDIVIDFSEKTAQRQASISKVKRVLNLMAPTTPASRRKAVSAYDEIPSGDRKKLRLLLYKGKKLDGKYTNLTNLFLTKDSEWAGGEWTNPKVREDTDKTSIEMMQVVMESAGEDKMKPPKKISELDVGRKRDRFLQSEKDRDLKTLNFTFEIDDLLGGQKKVRTSTERAGQSKQTYSKEYETAEMSLSKVKEILVYAEDRIEDNIEDGEPVEDSKAILKSVAKIVAFYQVVAPVNSSGSPFGEMSEGLDDARKLVSEFETGLERDRSGANVGSKASDNSYVKNEMNRILQQFTDARREFDRKLESESSPKTPYKGSLKQALEGHAEKLKFDLNNEIEQEQLPEVKKQYYAKMNEQRDSMSEAFDEEMDKIDEMAKGNSN